MENVDPATAEMRMRSLLSLQKNIGRLRQDFSRNAGIPRPHGPMILKASDPLSATVDLFEGSLRYYPLELEGVRRGDLLRAYFKCHLPETDQTVTVRLDRHDLEREKNYLQFFDAEPVADWNGFQVGTAKAFIDMVPENARYGVPEHIVQDFFKSHADFKNSLRNWTDRSFSL